MLKQSRSFPCCHQTSTEQKKQILMGLLISARSPVWASEILWWRWWPIQTPYHAFYTTLHNVQYQTVSAAIPATRDKPSCIVTYLHLKTWGQKTLSEINSPPVGCEMVRCAVSAFVFYNQTDESIDLRVSCQIVHSRNIVSFRSCLFKY